MGAGTTDDSFRLLRGILQGLPPGHLLHHVRSHAGDPYSEFVDHVAKQEASTSFHHPPWRIDMQKWYQIPHFWLIFGHVCGLPPWKDGRIATPVPTIPAHTVTLQHTKPEQVQEALHVSLSLASANVLSLSRGPERCRGKLHYLFEQMKHFGLNILGLPVVPHKAVAEVSKIGNL